MKSQDGRMPLWGASRPRSWLYVIGPFAIGVAAAGRTPEAGQWVWLICLAAYFSWPANALVYGFLRPPRRTPAGAGLEVIEGTGSPDHPAALAHDYRLAATKIALRKDGKGVRVGGLVAPQVPPSGLQAMPPEPKNRSVFADHEPEHETGHAAEFAPSHAPVSPAPKLAAYLPPTRLIEGIVILNLPFLAVVPFIPPPATLALELFWVCAVFYALPPIRGAQRAGLDILMLTVLAWPAIAGFGLLTGKLPGPDLMVAACLWSVAAQLVRMLTHDLTPSATAEIMGTRAALMSAVFSYTATALILVHAIGWPAWLFGAACIGLTVSQVIKPAGKAWELLRSRPAAAQAGLFAAVLTATVLPNW